MQETTNLPEATVRTSSYELLEKFTSFSIPDEVKDFYKKMYPGVPLNKLKIMLFASKEQLNNEDINYWMAIKPERQSDELFVDYKNRQRLQKFLLKYRPYIFDYSQTETN